MSAQLVRTQLAYPLSLRGYFAAVEKFADAQVKIADYASTKSRHRRTASLGSAPAPASTLPARRKNAQRIIDQLVKDVAGNTSADLPLKRKITDAVASLKQRDQELESLIW